MNLIIIDTGCANLSSVKFAFERLGYQPKISRDLDEIKAADKLLLPGVGTAKSAMKNLTDRNLIQTIQQAKYPLLGICLGMQMLTNYSTEGDVETLGIINARTEKLSACGLPLPHMGWNQVNFEAHPLFENIPNGSHFYFVHSYGVLPNANTIATCDYSVPFSAVLQNGNFYGAQFHPERSGKVGSQFLRNFMENI